MGNSYFPIISNLQVPLISKKQHGSDRRNALSAASLASTQKLFLEFLVRTYSFPWISETEQKEAAAVLFGKWTKLKRDHHAEEEAWKATYDHLCNLEVLRSVEGGTKSGTSYPDGFTDAWDAILQHFKEKRLIRETWIDFDLADRAQYSEDFEESELARKYRKERQEFWITIYEDPWRLTKGNSFPVLIDPELATPENYAEIKGFGNLVTSLRKDRKEQKENTLDPERRIVYHGVTIVDVHQVLGAAWDNVLIVKAANPNIVAAFLLRLRAYYPSISNTRTATRIFYRSQWSFRDEMAKRKKTFSPLTARKVLEEYRLRLKSNMDASYDAMALWFYDGNAKKADSLGTFKNIYTFLKKTGILREWRARSFNALFSMSETGHYPLRYWVLIHLCNPPSGQSKEIFLDRFEDEIRLQFFFQPSTNDSCMLLKTVEKHIGADFSVCCEVLSRHEDATSEFLSFLMRRSEVKQTHTVSVLVKPDYIVKRDAYRKQLLPDYPWAEHGD